MISHIRIQNLRSLVDTGFVEIKPLTILLGSNSSGKSTFLRSFPLFTQSVSKSLREPISWFDDALVDFGDFETAKSRMAKEGEGIVFSYKFREVSSFISGYGYHSRLFREHQLLVSEEICNNSMLEISFQKDQKGTFVDRIKIVKESLEIVFSISDRNANVNILVNGVSVLEEKKWRWKFGPNRAILPEFDFKSSQDDSPMERIEESLASSIHNYILQFCSPRLKHDEKVYNLMGTWTANKEEFLQALLSKVSTNTFRNNVKKWSTSNTEFLHLYNMLAIMNAVVCFTSFDYELRGWYGDCSYIAPIRAAANRFYRTQGLQVRDVDPYGKNLQEFILSLSGRREQSYRSFTESVLGLTVKVKNKNGHQQIVLSKENKDVNLADVGFGYSQILPIITKFWLSIDKATEWQSSRRSYRMFESSHDLTLIEQPELHLHPAMQARTADIMMLALNEMKNLNEKLLEEYNNHEIERYHWHDNYVSHNPSMIVETHSQAMINRIGRRIREKRFSADDVSILLFEKSECTGQTQIKKIGYNETGQLTNWPYGFFEPTKDNYDILFDKQFARKGE